ncbi:MAG TPA: hypothetical protein VGX23_06970 [Actinocrinis sp.]|nr:hypothetical protein [Actinocrinis sp.]
MPFEDDELSYDLLCGRDADGHWRGWFSARLRADALRRLGLHPDQPTAEVVGPGPPRWWHAAAEERLRVSRRARR